jgi:hypothetical protein
MATKFGDFFSEPDIGEQGCDFRPQTASRSPLFVNCAPKNLPDFFLHAAAMPRGAALETRLNLFFYISNDKLGHASLQCFITIS